MENSTLNFVKRTSKRLGRCREHYIVVFKGNLVWEGVYDKTPSEMISYCELLEEQQEDELEIKILLVNYISVLEYQGKNYEIFEINSLGYCSNNHVRGRVRKIKDDALFQQIKLKSTIYVTGMVVSVFLYLFNYSIVISVIMFFVVFISMVSFISRVHWFNTLIEKSLNSKGKNI